MAQHHLKAFHDGSGREPRLQVLQSWWGMIGLGENGKEWSFEEKFEKIAEAGFHGIQGAIPAPAEAELWRRKLDEYGFSFGIGCFPAKCEDLAETLRQAADFGVQIVNCQVMDNWVIDDEAVALLTDLIEVTAAQSIPAFFETHRGRVTQDLHRTVQYVRALPELRLTIDFSHYAVAGEMTAGFGKAMPLLDELLRRTSCIHGRVSNGEQVQVDIGPNAEHPLVSQYVNVWEQGMRYWLADAQPGDILPVVPELGPPGYAITKDGYAQSKAEISDRWQQSLLLKQLFEGAWERARSAATAR